MLGQRLTFSPIWYTSCPFFHDWIVSNSELHDYRKRAKEKTELYRTYMKINVSALVYARYFSPDKKYPYLFLLPWWFCMTSRQQNYWMWAETRFRIWYTITRRYRRELRIANWRRGVLSVHDIFIWSFSNKSLSVRGCYDGNHSHFYCLTSKRESCEFADPFLKELFFIAHCGWSSCQKFLLN